MSLATRCPACGTVFRVVPDQLKVSGGWVRCGRCSEVFNAGQRLFELEAGAAASMPPAAPGPQATRDASSPALVRVNPALAPLSRAAEPAAGEGAEGAEGADAAVGAGAAQAPQSQLSPQEVPMQATAAETTPTPAPIDIGASAAAKASIAETAADAPLPEPTPTPGFVLRAERAARRRQPKWRGALAVLSLLLLLLLGAQIALHFRDDLAAGWPASRPWLLSACTLVGCRIEPPRHIDSLAVDSSALVRIEGSPVYRLSLVVQNRSATVVRMPAIDLALTDTQGQTTARRILLGAELGQPSDHLPPRGEVALQALLDLGEQVVAGYTVELFYP